MQRIQIGKILRPRGLKGELKVQAWHQLPTNIFVGGKQLTVIKISQSGSFTFLFLDGITTLDQAEQLRGKAIEIEKHQLAIADDEVLTSDLIGFDVIDSSGKPLGKLRAIENFGASDIFDCGTFSFPYEDAFVIETNMTSKKIVVRAERLSIED